MVFTHNNSDINNTFQGLQAKKAFNGLILLVMFFLPSVGLSQSTQIDTSIIPNVDSCKASLIRFYQKKTKAEQAQYNYKVKFQWLKFIPNLGWNFIINTPSISTNFNVIADQINNKRAINATLESIHLTNEVMLNNDLVSVTSYIKILTDKVNVYEYEKNVYYVKLEKFDISDKQYKHKEITPTQFMQAKEEKITAEQHFVNVELEIKNLKHLVLEKAKQLNWVELPAIINYKP